MAKGDGDVKAGRYVGKAALCRIIGWSRPTLDLRLVKDPHFPVRRRGGKGAQWEFDVAAVQSYLAGVKLLPRDVEPVKTGRPRKAATAEPIVVPPASGEGERLTHGEQTQRQRRDAAQAAMIEDNLRTRRGELVESEEMRLVLTTMLARLGSGLDSLADSITSRLRLPADDALVLTRLIDELRQTMVRDLKVLLKPPAS